MVEVCAVPPFRDRTAEGWGTRQYPANNSVSSLAATLAAEINSTSPLVFATVSGVSANIITITATVNGSATNYPLSTSYGFNTSNFSSPAFQAAASGPSLTGGVD